MRQSQEVKAFKNELNNYNFYKIRVEKLQSLIDFCYSMLPGSVHSIDYSRLPGHSPPNKEQEYKVRSEIEKHERNKRLTQEKIRNIDETLAKIDIEIRSAIIAVYVDGNKLADIAEQNYISANALQYRINKAIEGALNE